jgi:hypothetical protein
MATTAQERSLINSFGKLSESTMAGRPPDFMMDVMGVGGGDPRVAGGFAEWQQRNASPPPSIFSSLTDQGMDPATAAKGAAAMSNDESMANAQAEVRVAQTDRGSRAKLAAREFMQNFPEASLGFDPLDDRLRNAISDYARNFDVSEDEIRNALKNVEQDLAAPPIPPIDPPGPGGPEPIIDPAVAAALGLETVPGSVTDGGIGSFGQDAQLTSQPAGPPTSPGGGVPPQLTGNLVDRALEMFGRGRDPGITTSPFAGYPSSVRPKPVDPGLRPEANVEPEYVPPTPQGPLPDPLWWVDPGLKPGAQAGINVGGIPIPAETFAQAGIMDQPAIDPWSSADPEFAQQFIMNPAMQERFYAPTEGATPAGLGAQEMLFQQAEAEEAGILQRDLGKMKKLPGYDPSGTGWTQESQWEKTRTIANDAIEQISQAEARRTNGQITQEEYDAVLAKFGHFGQSYEQIIDLRSAQIEDLNRKLARDDPSAAAGALVTSARPPGEYVGEEGVSIPSPITQEDQGLVVGSITEGQDVGEAATPAEYVPSNDRQADANALMRGGIVDQKFIDSQFSEYSNPLNAIFESVVRNSLGDRAVGRPGMVQAAQRGYEHALGNWILDSISPDRMNPSFHSYLTSSGTADPARTKELYDIFSRASDQAFKYDDPVSWSKGNTRDTGLLQEDKELVYDIVRNRPNLEFSIVAAQRGIDGRGSLGKMRLDALNRTYKYWQSEQIRNPNAPKRGFISFYNSLGQDQPVKEQAPVTEQAPVSTATNTQVSSTIPEAYGGSNLQDPTAAY